MKDAMLDFLFRRLTTNDRAGARLFAAGTAEARRPDWYREGAVPDTIDGRFAMLSTIVALILVRLEREGERGNALGVALTERFIEAMESEHRELGLGDPTLGKTVRKLVGSLARRTDLWRGAVAGATGWPQAARESLPATDDSRHALAHNVRELEGFWSRLEQTSAGVLDEGRIE